MNWDQVEGNWKMVKGKVHHEWGRWTESPKDRFEGNREMLAGKIQELYGNAKEIAEKRVREFNRDNRDDYWI